MDDFDESLEIIPLSERIAKVDKKRQGSSSPVVIETASTSSGSGGNQDPFTTLNTPPPPVLSNRRRSSRISPRISDAQPPPSPDIVFLDTSPPPSPLRLNASLDSPDWIRPKIRQVPIETSTPRLKHAAGVSQLIEGSENAFYSPATKRTKSKKSAEEKEREKREKQEKRDKDREAKRLEKEREKQLKAAEREARKAKSISHAHENCVALIDGNVVRKFAKKDEIQKMFDSKSLKYRIVERNKGLKNSVVWKRKQVEVQEDWNDSDDSLDEALNHNGHNTTQSSFTLLPNEVEENHLAVIVPMEEYIRAAHKTLSPQDENGISEVSDDQCESLHQLVDSIRKAEPTKKLIVVVFSLVSYFRHLKSKANRNFVDEFRSEFDEGSTQTRKRKSLNLPQISAVQVEEAEELVKIRISRQHPEYVYSYRHVDNAAELASFLLHTTKAVSEAPYKRAATGQDQFSFYIAGEKGITVAPDTTLEVTRLWENQLQQFPMLAGDSATAISAIYPTPRSLYEAYKYMDSEKERKQLLSGVNVVRKRGETVTSRSLGPEMSRKISLFMTSTDKRQYLNY